LAQQTAAKGNGNLAGARVCDPQQSRQAECKQTESEHFELRALLRLTEPRSDHQVPGLSSDKSIK
jgi:hypothetical protein